jgi:MtN3 and saliva related transmembrane protein
MKTSWITIVGYIAAALTTFSSLPQVIKIFRTKKTSDISLVMYIMVFIGVLLWLVYGLLITDYPIIFANLVSLFLLGTVLVMKIRHG